MDSGACDSIAVPSSFPYTKTEFKNEYGKRYGACGGEEVVILGTKRVRCHTNEGHIIETDKLFVMRVKTVLKAQGVPEIPRTTPPWKLHEGKGYESLSADELIRRLKETSASSLKFVKDLKNEDWMRQGLSFGSKISMLDLGTWLANHDRGHLAQLKRLCEI